MKTAYEHLQVALGGNMNISTLTLSFWEETMQDFANQHAIEVSKEEARKALKQVRGKLTKISKLKWGDKDTAFMEGVRNGLRTSIRKINEQIEKL